MIYYILEREKFMLHSNREQCGRYHCCQDIEMTSCYMAEGSTLLPLPS